MDPRTWSALLLTGLGASGTALGGLIGHITGGHLDGGKGSFQPMNINYGLMPLVEAPKRDADGRRLGSKVRSQGRKLAMGERALADLAAWASDAPGQHSTHQSQAIPEV